MIEEFGGEYFSILANESSDVSQKEQLAISSSYVEGKTTKVIGWFLGLFILVISRLGVWDL